MCFTFLIMMPISECRVQRIQESKMSIIMIPFISPIFVVGWGAWAIIKRELWRPMFLSARGISRLLRAGFYALGKNTSYQIYVVPDFQGVASLANRMPAASGFVENRGFYTIDFEKPAGCDGRKICDCDYAGDSGSTLPMAIEYESGERTKNVDISDGEGYISNNGLDWENVEKKAKGNLCLKAYGNEKARNEKTLFCHGNEGK